MQQLDCRGMACPLPVVSVKRALEAMPGETLQVLLDAGAPRENVQRFLASRGHRVQEEQLPDGGFRLTVTVTGAGMHLSAGQLHPAAGEVVLLVASDRLGDGPEELGRLLMRNYLHTLVELPEVPDRLLFVNTGVLLATDGSEVLEALERLGNRGVEVLSCGVCLDYFGRKEQLLAGRVTNMFTIAEALQQARLVIRP